MSDEPVVTVTLPASAAMLADTLVAVTRAWYDAGYEEPVAVAVDGGLLLRGGARSEAAS